LSEVEKRWLTAEMNKYFKQDLDFQAIAGREPIIFERWTVATIVATLTSISFAINK